MSDKTNSATKSLVFSLIGLLFNIFLIYKFLTLWTNPQVEDIDMIFNLIVLLMFEFFLIPTGMFIILARRSFLNWLFGSIFFGTFALAFNSLVKGNFILIIFVAMVLNRILFLIFNRAQTDRNKEMNKMLLIFLMYFGLVVLVAITAYFIPRFGLTETFLVSTNYMHDIDWEFEMLNMPHISMCFGILYYLALTIVEIVSFVNKKNNVTITENKYLRIEKMVGFIVAIPVVVVMVIIFIAVVCNIIIFIVDLFF